MFRDRVRVLDAKPLYFSLLASLAQRNRIGTSSANGAFSVCTIHAHRSEILDSLTTLGKQAALNTHNIGSLNNGDDESKKKTLRNRICSVSRNCQIVHSKVCVHSDVNCESCCGMPVLHTDKLHYERVSRRCSCCTIVMSTFVRSARNCGIN